jgi:hypothetical protein
MMGADMDWKLEKKKKERNIAFARRESAINIELLDAVDREFENIFGKLQKPVLSPGGNKPGDPVRRSEINIQGVNRKTG